MDVIALLYLSRAGAWSLAFGLRCANGIESRVGVKK